MKILVIGGSGYLGQFVVRALAERGDNVVVAVHSKVLSDTEVRALGACAAVGVDMRTGQGLDQCRSKLDGLDGYRIDAVVNCAAISVPRECEHDRDGAFAVNVPSALLRWMPSLPHWPKASLLIHMSTDQVYDGAKSYYKEEDDTRPVNTYGESKLAAEATVRGRWTNYAILRSSIIVGPDPRVPIRKTLPVQWMDTVLSDGQHTNFFEDEFRNPVYVHDVVKVILRLIDAHTRESETMQHVLNVGGPDRLSRADMAATIAKVRGHNMELVRRVPSSSANRGVTSPLDISMDISQLVTTIGVTMTPFETAVKEILDC